MLALAEDALARGEAGAAIQLLDALASSNTTSVDQTQVAFLRAVAAARTGDLTGARDRFRTILEGRPNLTRVRLELASTLFLLNDDEAAAYHFRLALADTNDRAVQANIERFLASIQARKRFIVDVSFGVAPDSNINAGTANETINLFGVLPARISDDARETSGVGLTGGASTTWLPHISERLRGEFRVGANGTQYSGADFDDFGAFAEAGLRLVRGRGYVSLTGTYDRRWYGGELFYDAPGIRATAVFAASQRWTGWASASSGDFRYKIEESRNGPVTSLGLGAAYTINAVSVATLRTSVTREATQAPDQRNWSYSVGPGYERQFSNGITGSAHAYYVARPFDDFSFLFGETRRDDRYGLGASALHRKWTYRGLTPRIAYSYERNYSNVSIFDHARHQVEFTFTRQF